MNILYSRGRDHSAATIAAKRYGIRHADANNQIEALIEESNRWAEPGEELQRVTPTANNHPGYYTLTPYALGEDAQEWLWGELDALYA